MSRMYHYSKIPRLVLLLLLPPFFSVQLLCNPTQQQVPNTTVKSATQEEASAIDCTLHITSTEPYDESAWNKMLQIFVDFSNQCESLDNSEESWNIIFAKLGEPFISLFQEKKTNGTMNGNITIALNEKSVDLKLTITHEKEYDRQQWQTLLALLTAYAQKTSDSYETLKKESPLLNNILTIVEQNKTLHAGFTCTLDNGTTLFDYSR